MLLLPINKSIFYKWQNRFFAEKVLMQHQFEISKKPKLILQWFPIILDLRTHARSFNIYRATDLKMQLDTLRMENLDPLQKN
jgi:hypothetical protein